jgi:tetratricopeptide (TPR) repeat protein
MSYVGLLSTLAYTLGRQNRQREAVATYRRAKAVLDSTGRGGIMLAAVVDHDQALSLLDMGESVEAERLLHDVLQRVMRGDPGGVVPRQLLIHYSHAALFGGHLDSARRYFALLVKQTEADDDPYWEGRALFGQAQAEVRSGRLAEARRTIARFESISANPDLRKSDDQIVDRRILDAFLAVAIGNHASAHASVVAALRARGYFDGERKRVFRVAVILAAETALSLGKAADALRYAGDARAIATRDPLAETRSAYVGEARLIEGRALLASGDTSGARAALQRAHVALRNGGGAQHPRVPQAEALLLSLAPRAASGATIARPAGAVRSPR